MKIRDEDPRTYRTARADMAENAIEKAVAAIMALVVHSQHEAGPETDRLKQSGVDVTGRRGLCEVR
jgi:hypothetical protein